MKFRTRPVDVRAFRWTGTNYQELVVFCPEASRTIGSLAFGRCVKIPTVEGELLAREGDWITRGPLGEYCVVAHEIFTADFEPIADEVDA